MLWLRENFYFYHHELTMLDLSKPIYFLGESKTIFGSKKCDFRLLILSLCNLYTTCQCILQMAFCHLSWTEALHESSWMLSLLLDHIGSSSKTLDVSSFTGFILLNHLGFSSGHSSHPCRRLGWICLNYWTEVASVINLSEVSGRVAASLFMTEGKLGSALLAQGKI